jgi:hypothetical protein
MLEPPMNAIKTFAVTVPLIMLSLNPPALADGPGDNLPENVRRIPKLGIKVPAEKEARLRAELAKLKDRLAELDRAAALDDSIVPDAKVYYKAVHDALEHQEFFSEKEVDIAFDLLKEGLARADAIKQGKSPWLETGGLIVRGYQSFIDGSVQPYGLVVPKDYKRGDDRKYRLDLWFHGRGETLSELAFIDQRRKSVGQIQPANTIVLHPYGRYCNANKFAGEIDALEAIAHVKQSYDIDEDRISVRGFSMGGAAAWHFAVHYADQWFAANPGAGFSETPDFLKVFQNETLKPTWWEKKLWHMYDCTDWAVNLRQLPTVAYSGENDKQKQAADIMAKAFEREGMTLMHIIGPKTGHSIHKDSAVEIERLMAQHAEKGRHRVPREIHFVTYTLRYDRMHWLQVDELEEHWEEARVVAKLDEKTSVITLTTKNVTGLTLMFDPGLCPFDAGRPVTVTIDGTAIDIGKPAPGPSIFRGLHHDGKTWRINSRPSDGVVRKRRLLQGPIDDAFMYSFLFVRPTSKARNELVEKWTTSEMERAIAQWRQQFRGDARVKNDTDVTEADMRDTNVVLWGDPQSNAVLKKMADKLPIKWGVDVIPLGEVSHASKDHALILIAPNPLAHGNRYVVLNSGFTYREYAYLNNARQVPMLPDWAVVDLKTPPNSVWPGKIVSAGFFDEQWRLKPLKKGS